MHISRCNISIREDRVRASWIITLENSGVIFQHTGSKSAELWIDWPLSYYSPDNLPNDAALIIALPLAMRLRERVKSDGEISGQLIMNTLEAMHIYKAYFPDYVDIVPLEVVATNTSASRSPRIASFYSGGVDSLFNISETIHLNHTHKTPNVTDLWLVRGMDISLKNEELWNKVKTQLWRPEYLPTELKIVDVWTNARDLHGKIVGWEQIGFGPILGGISKCFSSEVGQVLIGSYAKYIDVGPHSSSPLVDPMWSCDQQTIRHFSCRADRSEKVLSVCENIPESLNLLRVCWKNEGNSYNCGKCEKCLRTQMQLEIYGYLDKCPNFDEKLSIDNLQRNLAIPWQSKNFYTRTFWLQLERELTSRGEMKYSKIIRKKLMHAKLMSILNFFPEKRKIKNFIFRRGKV